MGCSKAEALANPIWDYLDCGTHQHSLHPKNWRWKSRRFAHDPQELEYDGRWLQPASHEVE
jgi:hypothetical protein